ncbi:sorbosone dehydrogenase family protein [Legionella sp. MW5194]|uniref:PQQ-dependent sugar dehydrogenase n=1 Tax=Legionella sp. MW5194 TaxID=2662448 RepID=UPI00193EA9A3|nr:PQQ-dependent sugar dehydrogenase [Legionella sp. MW5194]QRN03027.1 sorbosone dehydrogenase family protein [Legionella sp. MW5194]
MKKLLVVSLVALSLCGLTYLSLPLLGFNIAPGELVGSSLSFLKASPEALDSKAQIAIKPYVKHLENPRFMHVTSTGDLLVSEPFKGRVLLIPYQHPQQRRVLIEGLQKPHSMDVRDGYLYVAEENAIGRIAFQEGNATTVGRYKRLITGLPSGSGHWTRTIRFGPDGYAYVSIGSSCNACLEKNPLRATISRFKPGEPQLSIYARGLRNSVGFDWSPEDGKLYATENGRDLLGDHFPPEELNVILENQFYGWPYANGNRVPDPDYGKGHEQQIKQSLPPVFELSAHQAPLGLTFIKNRQSPWYGKALVALHGSWNSSMKVGYKVVMLTLKEGHISVEDFITGFLKDGKVMGRPVHVVEGKTGELYLSDDHNGIIYLIQAMK